MRKWFKKMKDGGQESKVTGYWLVEDKAGISIALLRFDDGSREAYHTHAFDSVSLVLWGALLEDNLHGDTVGYFAGEVVQTFKDTWHKVMSIGTTWVLTFRGPWAETWKEYLPESDEVITLTHGRKIIAREPYTDKRSAA